jgi:MEDS: MEthanogen/methylotroph, DcmR Sensory domain
MSTLGPARARQSYRHEAFLWNGRADFVRGLLPFIREGMEAGEAVMVATTPEHGEWLSTALGSAASGVHFVDMTELGRNPARIIPAWQQFLDDWSGYGRPARGIGEPIWEGRRPEEILECQLHEALLNLAVDPKMPFWLVCPYDCEHLDAEVLAEAGRSHPAIATTASYQGSRSYRGHDHAQTMFGADLPHLGEQPTRITVTVADLARAAPCLALGAAAGDLGCDKVAGLIDVVHRLAAESLHRGAGEVTVGWWDRPEVLVCEVSDTTVIDDLLVGRRRPQSHQGDAIWTANEVCDLVQVRSTDDGTVIRLHLRK